MTSTKKTKEIKPNKMKTRKEYKNKWKKKSFTNPTRRDNYASFSFFVVSYIKKRHTGLLISP